LERIGIVAVKKAEDLQQTFVFTWQLILALLHPKTYSIATVQVLVRQIYFTAIQILPFYLLLATILGSVVVGAIVMITLNLGIQDQLGSAIVNVLINELAPFLTVMFLALRSGTAITTEMAVMNVSGEMNALRYFNVDPMKYLFVPRVLNGILSMFLLTTMFSVVALISGYIFLALGSQMGLSLYIGSLVEAFGAMDVLVLLLKSLFFGYVVTSIPVYRGNKTLMTYNAVPIAVLQGMVKLFVAILFIEVLSFVRFM
jgi:phospholipid/cholesterol/gamma-HCH transport system permease protein